MKSQKAFTLIEVLIVISIFGVLSVIVLLAINPIEQINRARDAANLFFSSELYSATDRLEAKNLEPPWLNDVYGVPLESAEGIATLYHLITTNELKAGYVSGKSMRLAEIFMTLINGFERKAFCFLPKSHAYKNHFLAVYSIIGEQVEDCPDEGCYLCISSDSIVPSPQGGQAQVVATNPEDCTNFDPERPNYPFTCNYSDRYAHWGCTNYCVHDFACGDWCLDNNLCDDPCPEGQRLLVKSYYGVNHLPGGNFEQCLSHRLETRESYCVSDPYARCDIYPYPSYSGMFVWGCENPRRPIEWADEHEFYSFSD